MIYLYLCLSNRHGHVCICSELMKCLKTWIRVPLQVFYLYLSSLFEIALLRLCAHFCLLLVDFEFLQFSLSNTFSKYHLSFLHFDSLCQNLGLRRRPWFRRSDLRKLKLRGRRFETLIPTLILAGHSALIRPQITYL